MKKEYCSGEGSYILNYRRIKGADGNTDHLLIKYADGREEIEVYSIEREREILSIQKEQLKTVASKTEEVSKRRSKSTKKALGWALVSALYIGVLISSFNIPTLIVAGIFTAFSAKNIKSRIRSHRKLKDLEKYKMFIKNGDIINEKVNNEYEEAFGPSTEREARQALGFNTVDANNIDNYSYKDVVRILDDTDLSRDEYGDSEMVGNKLAKRVKRAKTFVKKRS